MVGSRLIAAAAALWIASWQGIPYLVLLVALCTFAAEFVMRRTRYGAELYAIDQKLDLPPTATRADVMKAIDGHISAHAALIVPYHQ